MVHFYRPCVRHNNIVYEVKRFLLKRVFLFLKCERPFDSEFFLGNNLPGRICDWYRADSEYSCF